MNAGWQAEDGDRTVIRPLRSHATTAEFDESWCQAAAPILTHPLIAAATPVLRLLAVLSKPAGPPDPQALRERVGQEITRFEKQCREHGISMELVRPAHYALCAAVDDAVLRTRWGPSSGWAERSLTLTRYRTLHDDNQFFGMVAQLQQDPARFLPALELFY
ncbi:MAG TPA: type IVB secretion system protein IcmH/DotU, partial [Rhodopila sp.]|nr:type IVB secretion system protein IcmH/DotU [Rhodopila sp.]